MDYDQRRNEQKERREGRPVSGIRQIRGPREVRGKTPASDFDREEMRIKAWETQRSAQLGRKWNFRLTQQMLHNTVAGIDLDLAAAGSRYSLKVKEESDGYFIEIRRAQGGGLLARSEKLPIRGLDMKKTGTVIRKLLDRYGIEMPEKSF